MILNGDRHELGLYVREIADLIGLRDWTVDISNQTPNDEEANAQVDVPFGRHYVSIKFKATWAEQDAETLRQTVVHELVHCHLWSIDQRICDVHGLISPQAYDVLLRSKHETLELAVDAIAQAWATFLPLPVKYASHVEAA